MWEYCLTFPRRRGWLSLFVCSLPHDHERGQDESPAPVVFLHQFAIAFIQPVLDVLKGLDPPGLISLLHGGFVSPELEHGRDLVVQRTMSILPTKVNRNCSVSGIVAHTVVAGLELAFHLVLVQGDG